MNIKHSLNNVKTKDLLLFILLFVLTFSIIIKRNVSNYDELWNYSFAQNIKNGLIPYKDFNMIQMPLLPIINGLVLKLTIDNLLIMRICGALLSAAIMFMIYKILKHTNVSKNNITISLILIGLITQNVFYNDYNMATLLMVLLIIYNELKEKPNDILIGIFAGISLCLKQTSGVVIILSTLLINKNNNIKKRIFGISIPTMLIFFYILLNGALRDFIDYAIIGAKDFHNSISYFELFKFNYIGLLALLLPLILIYSFTKIKDKTNYIILIYSLSLLVIIYPIADEVHFLNAIIPVIILFIYHVHKKIKIDFKLFNVLVYTFIGIVLYLNYGFYYYSYKSNLKHFEYIPFYEGLENNIKVIDNYIVNNKYKVLILDPSAVTYMIPIDRYDKNYNMLLKGNLGSNSYEKITKEINSNKNIRYLIRNNEDNWQIPKDIISFTKMNKKKIDEIGVYDVYSD